MTDKDKKSLQSYFTAIHAKTGKTAYELRDMAVQKGLVKSRDVLEWLKTEYGLGYGHAGAVWYLVGHSDDIKSTPNQKIDKLFAGNKSKWRKSYDALAIQVAKFGADVALSPNLSYINVLRGDKKFAIVQPASGERLDIGIKLKGVPPAGRFEAAGTWNPMVTHRVRINNPKELDKELVAWLKQAYQAVQVPKKPA